MNTKEKLAGALVIGFIAILLGIAGNMDMQDQRAAEQASSARLIWTQGG